MVHKAKKLGICLIVTRLFQMNGSIFPPAMAVALPCGVISSVLKFGQHNNWFEAIDNLDLLKNPSAWTVFSALLGFFVVFRTSQAYSRFWAGCTATHGMRMDWFNACTMLMAYCRISKAPEDEVSDFSGRLVRLVSILHAAALAELEEINVDTEKVRDITALSHDVLDPKGLDEESRRTLGESSCKVELIFMWIQMLIVEGVDRKIISPPPPVLSSVCNIFIKGMNSFGDALRMSVIPFPFPYVQTCDMLLVLHWFMTPMVVLAWVDYVIWAGILSFMQVFIIQALNMISVEIENPFGNDANDLDSAGMQQEMNSYLALFSKRGVKNIPHLNADAVKEFDLHLVELHEPLLDAFDTLDVELAKSDRKGRDFSRARIREKQREKQREKITTRVSQRVSLKMAGTSEDSDQGRDTPPPPATSTLQPLPPGSVTAPCEEGGPDLEQPEQPQRLCSHCHQPLPPDFDAGDRRKLGWDPPAPTVASPTASGPSMSAGGEENGGRTEADEFIGVRSAERVTAYV